ncbi:MAG: 16S rRNA (uracil(1498)-N(3))-methyltransferase [Spirochaetes bacterium]|nr:16S rRNA (uracil(1498)-N(3))-methyltransferase [Spirochaetota bacterium]
MPQFFISADPVDGRWVIEGDDFRHLTRVRRVRAGDGIILRDKNGDRLQGRIAEIFDTGMSVEIIDRRAGNAAIPEITLCAGILKGKKFDLAIQKAVETGVSRIVPVVTARTVPVLEGKEKGKAERWRKIALEAAKQCMRSDVPFVDAPMEFSRLVALDFPGVKLIAHTGADTPGLKEVARGIGASLHAALLVGPEGGFTTEEVARAAAAGWRPVRLGTTAMRAETAAMVLPAILAYEWGEDDEDKS